MADFLLELRSEEIPARMQAGARAELERGFRARLAAAGATPGPVTVWSTPRRLTLIARDLPAATEASREELKGPPQGAPDAAVDGFARKAGIPRDRLDLREVKGRPTWFAVIETPGRAMGDVLADAIPAIVRGFSWPKSMRWGAASTSTESVRWVRPLSGICALLGDEVVDCTVHGVTSGAVTRGHRFHHRGDITIGSAADYAMKLRAGHVIVDHDERATLIRDGAREVAGKAGLTLVEDEGLVVENAGLTEWPIPLLGHFDDAFLAVPPEVIQLTARVNQKYFVCVDKTGTLANAFVCTANIQADDGGAAIVDGNRKVLAARLGDARFFWQQDRKVPLAQQAGKLARITFHDKLATVADKVERVAVLARWLCENGVVRPLRDPGQPDTHLRGHGEARAELAMQAEQAARLCKADLVTEMVGEFPELQGLMGGYYARAEGLPDAVADAIRDHYKPVGQGDDVPSAPVTVALSLADKLDTIRGFFLIGEAPTGSKDPFALRRAAIAVIRLILANGLRGSVGAMLNHALSLHLQAATGAQADAIYLDVDGATARLMADGRTLAVLPLPADAPRYAGLAAPAIHPAETTAFIADRLKVQQREAGVRHDLVDAVFSLGGEDDLVRLLARVNALQNFVETAEGADLLAAYKRAANILKKERWDEASPTGDAPQHHAAPRTGEEDPYALVDDPDLGPVLAEKMREQGQETPSHTLEPAEQALADALDTAEPKARTALEREDFAGAMAALASLRDPIDAFFDTVIVNDADTAKRAARLDLLARFRAAVQRVGDFDQIEG